MDTAVRAAPGSRPRPECPPCRGSGLQRQRCADSRAVRSSRSLWALSSGAAPSPSPPPAGSCAPAPGAAGTAGKRPVLPGARRQRPARQRLPAPPDQGGADGEAGGQAGGRGVRPALPKPFAGQAAEADIKDGQLGASAHAGESGVTSRAGGRSDPHERLRISTSGWSSAQSAGNED